MLCTHSRPKSARCYQRVEVEVVKRSRFLSRLQGGVELRPGERQEERTVGTILDEIDRQGKATESMATFPAFGTLLDTRIPPVQGSDPARRSRGIPFLHMQYKAH